MRLLPAFLLAVLAATQMGGCGGDGGSSVEVPTVTVPNTTVATYNFDAAAWRLTVMTVDSAGPIFSEQVLVDPIAGAVGADPGTGVALVDLAPTSATIAHYFWIRDPATGGVADTSAEYLKGAGDSAVYVRILAGPVVQWSTSASGPWQ